MRLSDAARMRLPVVVFFKKINIRMVIKIASPKAISLETSIMIGPIHNVFKLSAVCGLR